MRPKRLSLPSLLLAVAPASAWAADVPVEEDVKAFECDSCAEWNQPHAPFRLHGNSYYVGVEGLSAILIATDDGLVLLDGGLPQSAPLIADNIRTLGFQLRDVKWIGMSHAHYDHAGGLAALVRMSGGKATVLATARGAEALRAGRASPDDPQAGYGDETKFPPVKTAIRVMADGESLRVGDTMLRLHATPGHTPGGSAWTWRSCENDRCLDMVYADSLTPVSADAFRFSDDAARVAQFRATIGKIRDLPCDVLVSAHPGFSQLFERQQRRLAEPAGDALVNPDACRAYADDASARLDKRLAEERGAATQE